MTARWFDFFRNGDSEGFKTAVAENPESVSLEGATFKNQSLRGFDFSNVDLSNSEWENCMLDKVSFNDAILEGAYFSGTSLIDCTFVKTNLQSAALDGCILLRGHFDGAIVDDTELSGDQFKEVRLANLTLRDVDWTDLTFDQCTFELVSAASGQLKAWTLRNADLIGFSLDGATVSRCRASVNRSSKLPIGFQALTGKRRRVG